MSNIRSEDLNLPPKMRYYLHDDDDNKKYIEDENGEKTRVHLIYCQDLESAKKLGSELVQCIPKFVGFAYPAFELKGTGHLALAIRGDSLDSILSDSAKGERLFNKNQMSPLYKSIIKSLMIVSKGLLEKNLRCSFDLDKIFIVQKDLSDHTEVVYISEIGNTCMREEFLKLVHDINEKLEIFHYNADEDEEMKFLLERMRAEDEDEDEEMNHFQKWRNRKFLKIMKSPFFWDWVKMKNFVCKVRRLCSPKYEKYSSLKDICTECFGNWETKVQKDADVFAFLVDHLKHVKNSNAKREENSASSSYSTDRNLVGEDKPLRPIKFIASGIKHFYNRDQKDTLKIHSVEEFLLKIVKVLRDELIDFIKE